MSIIEPTRGIYVIANDLYVDQLIALLSSIRARDQDVQIYLIPYNEDSRQVSAVGARFNAKAFPSDPLARIACLAGESFGGLDVRQPHKLRKLACWFGPLDLFLYVDTDVIVFDKIAGVMDHLESSDFVCCDNQYRGEDLATVFRPNIRGAGIFSEDQLLDVFNSGFFASKKGLFGEEELVAMLRECAEHRQYLDLAESVTDQPVLNYLVLRLITRRLNLSKSPDEPGSWAGNPNYFVRGDQLVDPRLNKPLRYLHWAGLKIRPGSVYWDIWLYYRLLRSDVPRRLTMPSARLSLTQNIRARYNAWKRQVLLTPEASQTSAADKDVTCVICHYNPTRSPLLRHVTLHCVASIVGERNWVPRVVVSDGSPQPDDFLRKALSEFEASYCHSGDELSFGKTYNQGLETAVTEFVVLVANDVFLTGPQIARLVNELRGTVGCTVPYLSFSDYVTQKYHEYILPSVCFPSSMTINVNAFRRAVLKSVGNVPEELSGCYNDVLIFHRLRRDGYRIGLVNAGPVTHLREATRKVSSNVKYESDEICVRQMYPDVLPLSNPHRNYWPRLFARHSQCLAARTLWQMTASLPLHHRIDGPFMRFAGAVEPYLCCSLRTYQNFVSTRLGRK